MSPTSDHTIRSLYFNFQYTGNADGMAIQQQTTEFCTTNLVPQIETILTEYNHYKEIVCIDKIYLDIDLGNTINWRQDLSVAIKDLLREAIHENVLKKGEKTISRAEHFMDMLVFFLEHGYFPWNSSIRSRADLADALGFFMDGATTANVHLLFQHIQEEKRIIRFLDLLTDRGFVDLMVAATGEPVEKIFSFIEDIQSIIQKTFSRGTDQAILIKDFRKILIRAARDRKSEDIYESSLTEWITRLDKKHRSDIKDVEVSPEMKKVILDVYRLIQDGAPDSVDTFLGEPEKEGVLQEKIPEEEIKMHKEEFSDGVFIQNAGAVIIASFLPKLFSKTGLVIENRITEPSVAISLLHYCITGRPDPAEFELLLPKILCGLPPEELIETITLSDDMMMQEADNMLAAVIGHWDVLKDTSADGLREAFLQRNGKLIFMENRWVLKVEQRSYDLLLDKLPWNIRMVKLPWMKYMLETHWI